MTPSLGGLEHETLALGEAGQQGRSRVEGHALGDGQRRLGDDNGVPDAGARFDAGKPAAVCQLGEHGLRQLLDRPFDDHGVPQQIVSIPSGMIMQTPACLSRRTNE